LDAFPFDESMDDEAFAVLMSINDTEETDGDDAPMCTTAPLPPSEPTYRHDPSNMETLELEQEVLNQTAVDLGNENLPGSSRGESHLIDDAEVDARIAFLQQLKPHYKLY